MNYLRLASKIPPITISGELHTPHFKPDPNWGSNSSLKYPISSPIAGKCTLHGGATAEEAIPVDKIEEGNGNWVLRVLQMRSLWKTESNQGIRDLNEGDDDCEIDDRNQGLIGGECDSCRVDDDDDDDEDDDDDDDYRMEFDKKSFSELLLRVSLSEARLYAKMAYLGSLSYTIPKIKLGNLLKRHKLIFVTSSLEKKALKDKTLEKLQQDDETGYFVDDSYSLYSSPCEWYICDDDESYTRYFVIQGSESMASWQANLLFEPIQFEAMDAIVHRGIYEASKVVYEELLPYVHDHLQRHGSRAIIGLTGHSLGGSLSLLVNLMLLIRGEVHISSLLPVTTFGAPWVMCGGDRLLKNLGLPRNHLQGITMHRDIVPRAFSCNYPTRVAHLLKVVNGNFRNHPCLNNQNLLYAPMGEFLILQPDAKLSPSHHLLPSGGGLYVLRSQASDSTMANKQTRAAQSTFLNTPHPLEILTDRCAYGSEGAILRDHDVDTYLVSIRNVIRQELIRARRMRRQQRRRFWWRMVVVKGFHVKLWLDNGREWTDKIGLIVSNRFSRVINKSRITSTQWWRKVVATQHMYLLVAILVPFTRVLMFKACNSIRFKLCM